MRKIGEVATLSKSDISEKQLIIIKLHFDTWTEGSNFEPLKSFACTLLISFFDD